MSRLNLALVAAAGILAGALGFSVLNKPAAQTDEAAVRSIVTAMLTEYDARAEADRQSVAELDPATLNPMIESYLLANPRILERVSNALQTEMRTAQRAEAKAQIAALQDAIYNDPDHVILGNPNGDVTLVEMFDYNCGYCRQALPDMALLLAEDPNLKVILKEFPILSEESVVAARVAVAVSKTDVDYWAFHQALFTSRGQVTGDSALLEAEKLGLNRITLSLDMQSAEVTKVIERSYELAKQLNISGTPVYIIGDELIPGAIGLEELRTRIANMRACGSTECEADPA